MTKTVLVTGATGYIGSHVCKHFKNAGYSVVGVDLVSRRHTFEYIDMFLQADYHSNEVYDYLEFSTPDAVVHCAGTSLVGPSVTDPAEYYINNVAKTAFFLDALSQRPKSPAVVFSSSAAVYGNPNVDSITEDTPRNPLSPYGQTKSMIETMLCDYGKAYGLRHMSLRYFNACGADVVDSRLGQAPGATHIVARLLESIRDNTVFNLYGNDYNTPDGTCIRDYVHVDDLAIAHLQAVEYLLNGGKSMSINLGSGGGYSNSQIIQSVSPLGNLQVSIVERREGDPDKLVASNALAKEVLGWAPIYSDLDTIVQSAWKWYTNSADILDI